MWDDRLGRRATCRNCAIRALSLCRALPDPVLDQMPRLTRRRKVRAGGQVLSDELGTSLVAHVVSGVVRLEKSLADGRTQIVGLRFASDLVGDLFTSQPSAVMAEAATDVELCCVPRTRFETLLASGDKLPAVVADHMARQLEEARDWMLLLGRKTAIERVASLVIYLAGHSGKQVGCAEVAAGSTIELPLSRTEMADFLGLTLETVVRMLKKLEQSGAIALTPPRGLTVLDAAALRKHATKDDG
jgi:CRP/FNR family transcriptional regulator, anaerobic regulatory protein